MSVRFRKEFGNFATNYTGDAESKRIMWSFEIEEEEGDINLVIMLLWLNQRVNLFDLSHPSALCDCSSSSQRMLKSWPEFSHFIFSHLPPPSPRTMPTLHWVILISPKHPHSSSQLCVYMVNQLVNVGWAWMLEAVCTRGGSPVGVTPADSMTHGLDTDSVL